MLSQYASTWKSRMQDRASAVVGPRRTSHGDTWQHEDAVERHQPQDGAMDATAETKPRVMDIHAHYEKVVLMEPEDARITGGTRSLMRRLMGLNVVQPVVKKVVQPVVATAKARIRKPSARKAAAVETMISAPEQAA